MRLTSIMFLFLSFSLYALDTTEPFNIGFTDNEVYLTLEELGNTGESRLLCREYVAGVGITDRLSTTFSLTTESDELLNDTETALSTGLFFSAITGDVFKCDLFGSFSSSGALTIATELNADFKQTGFQLTVEECFENNREETGTLTYTTTIVPLAYYSVNSKLQLLTAIGFSFGPEIESVAVGIASIGCNAVLHDAVELITEVGLNIPQNDENTSFSLSAGILATVP